MGVKVSVFLAGLMAAVWPYVAESESERCPTDRHMDDTGCLQHYFDTTSDLVLTPKRSYFITQPLVLRSGRHLRAGGAIIVMQGAAPAAFMLAGQDISIDGIVIENQTTVSGTVAIEVASGSEHLNVLRSRFFGAQSIAALNINAPDVSDVEFAWNEVLAAGYGVLTNWKARNLRHLVIAHNRMFGFSGGDGVQINYPVFAPPHGAGDGSVAPSDIRIEENTIGAPLDKQRTARFCIGIAGAHDVAIRNNTLSRCKWQGIHIEDTASDILIEDNTIDDVIGGQPGDPVGWKKFRDGIFVLNSRRVIVKDNTFLDIPDVAIDFAYDRKTFDAGNTICGNTLKRVGGYGISIMAAPGENVESYVGATSSCGPNRTDVGTKLLHTNTPTGLTVADP